MVIRYGVLTDSRLLVRRLVTTEPVVVAAPSYLARHPAPQSPLDLVQHNCLAYDRAGRPHRTWRFLRERQWTEVRVNGDRSVDDASLARQWALAGAGILLKSPIEQRHEMAKGELVHLLADWRTEEYPLQALLPSGRFVPRRVKALVNFLAAKFAEVASDLILLARTR
jgi:DNA-binding transcriptional LysR family regulator